METDKKKKKKKEKENSKIKKPYDYSKHIEYINNNLSSRCMMLDFAAKHITKRWQENNVDNVFTIIPSVIYFNNTYRLKITIESVIGEKNVIFFSRQEAISVSLWPHKKELKEAIQDFVFSVVGDLMEKGIEVMRVENILDRRARMYDGRTDKDLPKIENEYYPCLVEQYVDPNNDEVEFEEEIVK
jgi:tRNA G37 N-methylase Trm5